jgi:hypothetical protein
MKLYVLDLFDEAAVAKKSRDIFAAVFAEQDAESIAPIFFDGDDELRFVVQLSPA